MKKFISAALVIALAGTAQAQPAETLTLQRALELAMQQQPSLARTKATIEAAQARGAYPATLHRSRRGLRPHRHREWQQARREK